MDWDLADRFNQLFSELSPHGTLHFDTAFSGFRNFSSSLIRGGSWRLEILETEIHPLTAFQTVRKDLRPHHRVCDWDVSKNGPKVLYKNRYLTMLTIRDSLWAQIHYGYTNRYKNFVASTVKGLLANKIACSLQQFEI